MPSTRYLIVNADDFGQSRGVNQGIIEAHEHGIVTSASLMVRWPAACEAAAYGREHCELSVGLHLDLGEWAYREDAWVPLYEVVDLDDASAVAEEVSRQLSSFCSLVGKPPTHIDSHQHVHFSDPVHSIVVEVARKLTVPVRGSAPLVHFCGDFYGQSADGSPLPDGISVNRLVRILSDLPPGITELSAHPGTGNDLDTMYRSERAEELKTLCDPRVRVAIGDLGITLCSFGNINSGSHGRLSAPRQVSPSLMIG